MEKKALDNVNETVYRQFPYLQGVQPEVSAMDEGQFLLIYKGTATTADGHSLPISLRVISDKDGSGLKFTSSR
jgi:hypothetical protein